MCVLLVACGEPSNGSGQAVAPSTTSDLETALSACANDQQTVYDALQGTDIVTARNSLEAAAAGCRSAATELRKAPLPTIDPVEGPAAIDRMADGLAIVGQATLIMDRSPARARRRAQRGMHIYAAGLAKFNSAHHG
jgi:hypothetical protein